MDELTELQKEAFRLAGDGLTRSEIAERMNVSTSMVAAHLARVRKKLGVTHKRQLVPAARDYFA